MRHFVDWTENHADPSNSVTHRFPLWVVPQTAQWSSKSCCSSRVSFIEGSFPNLDIRSWGSVWSRTSDHPVSARTSLEGEGWKPEGQLALQAPVYHTWYGIWRLGRGRLFLSFQGCLLSCFLLVLISVFYLILFLSNIISPSFFSFNCIFAYLLHFVLQKDMGLASYTISWNHNSSSLMMAFPPEVSRWWTSQWEINISQFHLWFGNIQPSFYASAQTGLKYIISFMMTHLFIQWASTTLSTKITVYAHRLAIHQSVLSWAGYLSMLFTSESRSLFMKGKQLSHQKC